MNQLEPKLGAAAPSPQSPFLSVLENAHHRIIHPDPQTPCPRTAHARCLLLATAAVLLADGFSTRGDRRASSTTPRGLESPGRGRSWQSALGVQASWTYAEAAAAVEMLSSCPVGAEDTVEKPVHTMVGLHHLANEKARSCDASAPLLIVKYYAKGCRACAAIAPRYRALARDLGPNASCFEMEKRLFRVREPCSRAALTTCRVCAPACAARATASNTPPPSLSLLAADAGSSARRPTPPPRHERTPPPRAFASSCPPPPRPPRADAGKHEHARDHKAAVHPRVCGREGRGPSRLQPRHVQQRAQRDREPPRTAPSDLTSPSCRREHDRVIA